MAATWDIKQGNVMEVLKTMPDESVHCVVTSPPYWGLRDYKIIPQVWGGDPGCPHEWGKLIQARGKSSWESFNDYHKDG